MADEDIAQEIELRQWVHNNRSRDVKVRFAPGEPGYGPELCSNERCEVDMPVQRREWGFKLCVECQGAIEQRQRHMR
ncbi:TraR promoter binding protein [Pseudomonas phage Dolphis]|nr:TraR promoter binding protein [Pseudomonas phage Dolphis]